MNKDKDVLVDEDEVIAQPADLQTIQAEYLQSLAIRQLNESWNNFLQFL